MVLSQAYQTAGVRSMRRDLIDHDITMAHDFNGMLVKDALDYPEFRL